MDHCPDAPQPTFVTLRPCPVRRHLLALLTNDPDRYLAPPPWRGPHHGSPTAPPGSGGVTASCHPWGRIPPGAGGDALPELPALLVRPDRQPDRRVDAVGCAAVARPLARRQAAAAR